MPKVSFAKSEQTSGGGLFEGWAKLSNSRFGKSDYNGKAETEVTVLQFTAQHLDANDDLTEDEFIMSVGKGFEPSEDGETPEQEGAFCIPDKEGRKSNEATAASIFFSSLEDAGAPWDEEKGAAYLNDLVVRLERVAAPTDNNKARKVYKVAETAESAPWEKPAAKSASKPTFKATGKVPAGRK